jgi:hypothetical protein
MTLILLFFQLKIYYFIVCSYNRKVYKMRKNHDVKSYLT